MAALLSALPLAALILARRRLRRGGVCAEAALATLGLERRAATPVAALAGVALAAPALALQGPPTTVIKPGGAPTATAAPSPRFGQRATPAPRERLPEISVRGSGRPPAAAEGTLSLTAAALSPGTAGAAATYASAPAAAAPSASSLASPPRAARAGPTSGDPGQAAAAPTSDSTPQRPPPPPGPLEIADIAVTALSAGSARVSFRTSLPAASQGARGFATPTIFTPAAAPALEHEALFAGLDFATRYRLWLRAVDAWGRSETITLELETPALPERTVASAEGDTILRDGEPFFPLILWRQCSHDVEPKIALGINLFMGNGCGGDTRLLEAVEGQAFALVSNGASEGRGLLGWHHPDEWDERLPATLSVPELRALAPAPPAGLLDFLTLTNHFYSRAEPLPQGRGIYPALATLPDVVGFDLYPLQIWCRSDRFGDVHDAQRELHTLSGGKPSYQWIEVAPMEVCPYEHISPTPATVRAETWLAVAGGADGIGYFPNEWTAEVGAEIARSNRQLEELAPALLAEEREASSDADAVKVSARELGGALYVIAVNSSAAPLEATLHVPGLGNRELGVYEEARQRIATGDSFRDSFAPLEAHVYVAPPAGWRAVELSASPQADGADAGTDPVAVDLRVEAPLGVPEAW